MPEGDDKDVKDKEQEEANKGGGSDDSDSSSNGESEQAIQDRLNKVAGKSRDEGRTAGEKALLGNLGFEDVDEATAYLKDKREADDAEKSENERLTSRLEALEKRADDAESETKTVRASATADKLQSAVLLEIISDKESNVNPEAMDDIWVFLSQEFLGKDGIHIDENGKVLGVAKGLENLLKAKPYLASTSNNDDPGSDTRRKKDKVNASEDLGDGKPTPKYERQNRNPKL